jgi:hypothetical protein
LLHTAGALGKNVQAGLKGRIRGADTVLPFILHAFSALTATQPQQRMIRIKSFLRRASKGAFVSIVTVAALALSPLTHAQPDVVGQWSGVISWPIVNIDVILLPNGKLLVWPRDGGNQARVWDPGNNSFTPVPLPTMNLFCAGHAFMADGTLLVAGGHIADGEGERLTHIFDYRDNSWTRVADMNAGRWYPTTTTLGNGDVLVSSGSTVNYNANQVFQVWQASTRTWRTLTSNRSLPLYPFMHLAPDGRVFNSGPNTAAAYLNTAGSGSWSGTIGGRRRTFRDYGSSVQYSPGKIALIGGGDPPSRTAEVIDLNAGSPSWRAVGSMSIARRQMSATLLPDGSIFVNGGTSGNGFNDACNAVFSSEIWNPVTEQFTTMSSAAERRLYHSTAILLPDGRVLTGGGGQPAGENCTDADHFTVEYFSPPYLFKGTRPSLTGAPAAVDYGQVFSVGSSATIAKVSMIRLPSVTHAFDQNQLFLSPAFSQAGSTVTITVPTGTNACPPGHYMLFLVNGTGVPSVASIVQVKLPPDNTPPPPAPTGLVATGRIGDVSLTWNTAPGAATYNVKRGNSASGPFTPIASFVIPTSYVDGTVTPGNTYHYVVAGVNGGGEGPNSAVASATPLPPTTGTGTGLTGKYYDAKNFTMLRVTRIDPVVNFDWDQGSPDPSIAVDTFSVRWTGRVQPQYNQTYAFHATTDDGVRLWVNGVQIINHWVDGAAAEYTGTITLQANQLYTIQMDYYENSGAASAKLEWSSPSQPKQVIPQTQLYPQ